MDATGRALCTISWMLLVTPSLSLPLRKANQSTNDMDWCYDNGLDSTVMDINNLKMLDLVSVHDDLILAPQ